MLSLKFQVEVQLDQDSISQADIDAFQTRIEMLFDDDGCTIVDDKDNVLNIIVTEIP